MDDGILTTAFQVFAELLNDSNMTVDMSTDDTVEAVKRDVRAKEGIPEDQQRLIFPASNSTRVCR